MLSHYQCSPFLRAFGASPVYQDRHPAALFVAHCDEVAVPADRLHQSSAAAALPCSSWLPQEWLCLAELPAALAVALARGKLCCDAGPHPAPLPVYARQRLSVDPEYGPPGPCLPHHRDVVDHYAQDRGRSLYAQRFHQLPGHDDRDYPNLDVAYASHRASCRDRAVVDHDLCPDLDLDHHRDDNDANVDLAGSNSTDTSRRCRRTRNQLRTLPAPDATNCGSDRTGYADTRPSNRCSKPIVRSDMAPNPMARNQPTSSHKADTTSTARNDTAPNRCKR